MAGRQYELLEQIDLIYGRRYPAFPRIAAAIGESQA
jgi:hypothetical protein